MSRLKRVLTLLTGSFPSPPTEKVAPPSQDTVAMGPNMRRAIVRAQAKSNGEKHPGVAIAEARAEELRNKTGS